MPSLEPSTTQVPSSAPTRVLDGFNITTNSTSSKDVVTITRTFGSHTDATKTELLDAQCNMPVTSLLYKSDFKTTVGSKEVIESNITVKAEEITNSGDQGILFFNNGTLTTSPSTISGLIKFCLKSTSIETVGSLSVDIVSLKRIYTIGYSGDNVNFTVDNFLSINENISTNIPAFGNVLTNFTIDAIRCSATSTDEKGQEAIGEGDTFYVCIKPSSSDGELDDVNLLALYNYDLFDGEYDSNITLVDSDTPTISVVQLSEDGDWWRIAVPILALFTQGSSDKLSLQGNANVGFKQNVASNTSKMVDTTNRAGFGIEVQLILGKENGCLSRLFEKVKSLFF